VTSAATPVTVKGERSARLGLAITRDIARGGIAGAVAGTIVGGLGGRIVMRLAALIEPGAVNRITENGDRIGDITLSGSVALILFGGLSLGLFGGTVWVVVSPWIPSTGLRRALIAMPVAVVLTGLLLIDGDNRDFGVLAHDGFIVAMLIGLLAVAGLSIALLDSWLDRRLPRAVGSMRVGGLYLAISIAGGLLILPIVVSLYQATPWLELALVAVGVATLAWWAQRASSRPEPTASLQVLGRAALLVAVVVGALYLVPEVVEALAPT
jgi:hypothetical protein